MHNVLGLIFADSHYAHLEELTMVRPLAALPINGRYRSIDFTLSNLVNSGVINVAVVTQNNYHSLMGHLGSGKHWNLARKRYGGVRVVLTGAPRFLQGDRTTGVDIVRLCVLLVFCVYSDI